MPLITLSSGPRNARTDPDTGLRYYTWQGQEFVSVTSVRNLAGMPHKLATWRTTQVIDKAMAEYPMLGQMLRDPNVDPKTVASWLRKAADAKRDAAADLGKKVHDFAARGVSPADAPADVSPFLLQHKDFLAKSGLVVELNERQVFSPTHGYAGTFDLIGTIGSHPWMIDLKTGSGTYPEHAFQTEAYARADFVGEDDVIDEAATRILKAIPLANRAVLHLRPDGWSFKQIPGTERTWQAFLSLLDFALWTDDNPTLDSLLGAIREGKA